jgi:putative membrane protein
MEISVKNILRVFLSDLKRISTNVIAIVVIIGLTVIPSLYAWFNILSNWDPYGEESTSKIKVMTMEQQLME